MGNYVLKYKFKASTGSKCLTEELLTMTLSTLWSPVLLIFCRIETIIHCLLKTGDHDVLKYYI